MLKLPPNVTAKDFGAALHYDEHRELLRSLLSKSWETTIPRLNIL